MIVLNLKEICQIVNGKLSKDEDIVVKNIKTSSKEIEVGDVFLIINKGYLYIDEAIKNGCVALISEEEIPYFLSIKVENSIIALGEIARFYRLKYDIPLIAITGSNGKTTTKDLISLILSKKYKVLKTDKNNNNQIGLPNTLLKLDDSYDVVVVEMGMNHLKEIEYLSNICKPDYGIITNIGSSHIGNLGSKENILKAKLEILSGMDGKALIINNDDKYLKKIKYKNIIKVNKRSLRVKKIRCKEDIKFNIDGVSFIFKVPFRHILIDCLIAIKVGLLFNLELKEIKEALLEYKMEKGRLNIIKNKYMIIDDSYNSNYESLIEGLKNIKKIRKYKVIILGDMLELGEYSLYYHKKINRYLRKIKRKKVLLVGEATRVIKGIHFIDVDNLNKHIKEYLKSDCLIYIKGSRKINLDKLKLE